MGLPKLVLADAAISFLWVLYIALTKPTTVFLTTLLNLKGYEFAIAIGLIALNVFFFGWLGGILEGAMWNPVPLLAFYSVGASKDSLFSMAVRYPAQIVGAVGGVLAAKELVPSQYKHLLGGPQLKVDYKTGILAELILSFLITFSILLVILKGPKSKFQKNWLIVLATIAVFTLGSGYTGPSLNPANAFGWAYANQKHYERDHFLVFWLAPLAGSLISGQVFQLLFRNQRAKKEKAA